MGKLDTFKSVLNFYFNQSLEKLNEQGNPWFTVERLEKLKKAATFEEFNNGCMGNCKFFSVILKKFLSWNRRNSVYEILISDMTFENFITFFTAMHVFPKLYNFKFIFLFLKKFVSRRTVIQFIKFQSLIWKVKTTFTQSRAVLKKV